MAKFDLPGLKSQRDYFGPDGNMSQIRAQLDNTGKARAAGDTEFLMKLPRGVTVTKVEMAVSDAGTGTADIGTEQKGTGTWTDDADYFLDGASIAATAYFDSLAVTRHKPLYISEDNVYLTIKNVAANAAAVNLQVEFTVWYEVTGNH